MNQSNTSGPDGMPVAEAGREHLIHPAYKSGREVIGSYRIRNCGVRLGFHQKRIETEKGVKTWHTLLRREGLLEKREPNTPSR
jgi:hypothetical protein